MDSQHQRQSQRSRRQPAARDPAMTSINEPHKTQALKIPHQVTRKTINYINCGKVFKSRTKLMKHVFSSECQPISQPSQQRAAHPTAIPEKAAIPHNFEQPQQAQHTSDHTHSGYQPQGYNYEQPQQAQHTSDHTHGYQPYGYHQNQPHGYHHISQAQPQQRQPTRRLQQGSSRQQRQHQPAPQAAQGDLSHGTHKYQYNGHQSQYVGHGYFVGNQYHVNHSENLSQPGSHERSISATPTSTATSATTSAYSAQPTRSALPVSYSSGGGGGGYSSAYSARPSARRAPVASSSDEWSDRSSSEWESSDSEVGSDVSRAGGDRSDFNEFSDNSHDGHVHENYEYRQWSRSSSPEHEISQHSRQVSSPEHEISQHSRVSTPDEDVRSVRAASPESGPDDGQYNDNYSSNSDAGYDDSNDEYDGNFYDSDSD